MTDFRDGGDSKPRGRPADKPGSARLRSGVPVQLVWAGDVAPRLPRGRLARVPRKPWQLRPSQHGAAVKMVPARVRLGVVLLNGRVAGHADQCVHLFPLATGRGVPSRIQSCCGLTIEPRMAEVVSAGSGAPCVTCMLAASKPRWSPDGLVY